MKIITNEYDILHDILINNYIDFNNPMKTVRILIKYLYGAGLQKEDTKKFIINYLSHKEFGINIVKYEGRIKSAINYIYKRRSKLIYIEKVVVTKSELKRIIELDNDNREKVAFAYLIHSKIYNKINGNNDNWVFTSTLDIIRESQCNKPTVRRKTKRSIIREKFIREDYRVVISDLVKLGYIEMSLTTGKNTYKIVRFSDEDSEVEIEVKDFENYINYYLRWRYGTVDQCKECTKWFGSVANNRKYCNLCWKHKQREWDSKYQREKRRRVDKFNS